MSLPLHKGKEDNILTHAAGILITWAYQWLLSHTGKKSCMMIEDISINKSVGKKSDFLKMKWIIGYDS